MACPCARPHFTGPLPAGTPPAPASVSIINSASNDGNVIIEFTKPSADVASGFYFRLKHWTKGAAAVTDTDNVFDVTKGGSNILRVCRGDLTADATGLGTDAALAAATNWRLTVTRNTLLCGPATQSACDAGKFTLHAFGASSHFTGATDSTFFSNRASCATGTSTASSDAEVGGGTTKTFVYYGALLMSDSFLQKHPLPGLRAGLASCAALALSCQPASQPHLAVPLPVQRTAAKLLFRA